MMFYGLDLKDWLAIADIVLKTLISGGLAWIGWLTYKINSDKLKLDLYNRRLEVYLSAVDFFCVRTLYSPPEEGKAPTANEPSPLRDAHFAFVRQTREAPFLFGENSEIYTKINNFSKKLLDPKTSPKELPPLLDEIEKALIPWLHFANISKTRVSEKKLPKPSPVATPPSSQS
jgi:hypothetical protein